MPHLTGPTPDLPGRLSPDEAALLASQVAGLARAGLPLGEGLRAMGAEAGPRRVEAVLGRIADRIDAGMPLEEAIASEGARLPAHLAQLIVTGVASGRLVEVVEELAVLTHKRSGTRRRLAAAMTYPLLLLTVLVLLGALFGFAVVPQFAALFGDFDVELPAMTQIVIALSGPRTWIFLGFAAALAGVAPVLYGLRRLRWARRLLHEVPVIGPVERWGGLAVLARLLAVLLDQGVPLPGALRLAGEGTGSADLRAACESAAARVEAGGGLDECCAPGGPLPASTRPLLAWGQSRSSVPAALRAVAEVFEGRVQVQMALVEGVAPSLVLLVVLAGVAVMLGSMYPPLISLIQKLTG